MPDTASLKLINLNVNSIHTEVAEYKAITCDIRESNIKQGLHAVEKGYANTDADSKIKQSANGQSSQDSANKITNYFFSSPNVEADKNNRIELM